MVCGCARLSSGWGLNQWPSVLLFSMPQIFMRRLSGLSKILYFLFFIRATNRYEFLTARKKFWFRFFIWAVILLCLCWVEMCLLQRGSDGSFQLAVFTGIYEALLWGVVKTQVERITVKRKTTQTGYKKQSTRHCNFLPKLNLSLVQCEVKDFY